MDSETRLQEIAAVEAAATPRPWEWEEQVIPYGSWKTHFCGPPNLISMAEDLDPHPIVVNRGCDDCRADDPDGVSPADKAFITDARQAVPELLADRAELVARVAALERALGATLRAMEPVVRAQEHPGPPFVATPLDAAYDSGRRALTGKRL